MNDWFWWIRQITLTVIGCFFILFGVYILIASYSLNDPASFILAFFASNLMILISAVLVVGFIRRMCTAFRKAQKPPPDNT